MAYPLSLVILYSAALGILVQAQRLSGVEILRRVEKNLSGVQDYIADLEVEVNMERVRIPKMNATLYFKAPDRIFFEAPNFALLPREAFGPPLPKLLERYDASLKEEDTVGGRKAYKLQLVAKDPTRRPQQLFLWVDEETLTPAKTETVPYPGRTVKIRFTYELQAGMYWLPSRVHAGFETEGKDTSATGPEIPGPAAQLDEMRRAMRSGKVDVRYSNYRINTGLSDDVFQRRPKE